MPLVDSITGKCLYIKTCGRNILSSLDPRYLGSVPWSVVAIGRLHRARVPARGCTDQRLAQWSCLPLNGPSSKIPMHQTDLHRMLDPVDWQPIRRMPEALTPTTPAPPNRSLLSRFHCLGPAASGGAAAQRTSHHPTAGLRPQTKLRCRSSCGGRPRPSGRPYGGARSRAR